MRVREREREREETKESLGVGGKQRASRETS